MPKLCCTTSPVWRMPNLWEFGLLMAIGAIAASGQYCMIRGYKEAEASAAQPLEYVRLVYAALIGYVVFAEVPTVYTWAGAALIIASSLYTIRRNAMKGSRGG